MPPPPFPIRTFSQLPRRPLPADGAPAAAHSPSTGMAAFRQAFAARGFASSAETGAFSAGGPTYRTISPAGQQAPPHPDPQVLLEGIAGKIDDAAKVMETNVGKLFEQLTEEVQRQLDAMNRRHREELEASERKQKAEWSVMAEYFNRLQERVNGIEEYVTSTTQEFMRSHLQQYHKMYNLERRHLLRHDVSFNTLFRHMQGNEGVFDRWSNRLSRIEAALQLPIGTFAEYNPLRSGEYEEALKIAKSAAEDVDDDELWQRLVLTRDRFEVFKGKYPRETPTPNPSRGNTPIPEPGPSRFEGSYRTPSPNRMSMRGGDDPVIDDQPATPRREPPDSDDVEFVGGFQKSPCKPQDDDEVEIVESAALTSQADAGDDSGDIQMLDLDGPCGVAGATNNVRILRCGRIPCRKQCSSPSRWWYPACAAMARSTRMAGIPSCATNTVRPAR